MNLTRVLTVIAAVGTLVCTSCQSSKIAYGNSYYFKATPRKTAKAPELYASTAPVPIQSQPLSLKKSFAESVSPPSPIHQAEKQTLTRREARQARKAQRKAVRTQLKQWLKAAPRKASPQEVRAQAEQQVEGFSRAGIIVGAAGLVMLLVGVLASGAFLVTLGGILLGIGLVLILIDVL